MYKAYCDEGKAVFLCLMQKKKSQIRLNLRLLAEMVGFEPTCPIKDKTISSRSRYDRFDTSPYISLYSIAKKRFSVNTFLPLRHGTAASHTQPCRFAFLGQKARFLCKKGCSFGREPSIIGTIFFKFEVQRRAFQWHRQNKIWAPAASKS